MQMAKVQLVLCFLWSLLRAFQAILTADQKVAFLQAHNFHRGSVNPSAADMLSMRWSDALAELAQKTADNCDFKTTGLGGNSSVGENTLSTPAAAGRAAPNYADLVKSQWFAEAQFYDYSSGTCSAICNHYTELVRSSYDQLGCGAAYCNPVKRLSGALIYNAIFVVCKYGFAATATKGMPYVSGPPCSACPLKRPACSNRLCDAAVAASSSQPPVAPSAVFSASARFPPITLGATLATRPLPVPSGCGTPPSSPVSPSSGGAKLSLTSAVGLPNCVATTARSATLAPSSTRVTLAAIPVQTKRPFPQADVPNNKAIFPTVARYSTSARLTPTKASLPSTIARSISPTSTTALRFTLSPVATAKSKLLPLADVPNYEVVLASSPTVAISSTPTSKTASIWPSKPTVSAVLPRSLAAVSFAPSMPAPKLPGPGPLPAQGKKLHGPRSRLNLKQILGKFPPIRSAHQKRLKA